MCNTINTSSSPDFSNFDFHFIFTHCDDICTKKITDISHNLLSYLAWSNRPQFNWELCYNEMYNRVPLDSISHYNINNWENHIFTKRIKLLTSNNKAYELAVKINPSAKDLEEFSKIDPCFATLFPVKAYIHDHPEIAADYRGMLPFGREVILYFNSIVSSDMIVKGSPSFKDHVNLREITNRKAALMGMPSITINNVMYHFGRIIRKHNGQSIKDRNADLDTDLNPDLNNIIDY